MLRLYDYLPSGNGYKVRLLLAQLGIPYERVELNIIAGETRTPQFLRLNPNGRIPLLVTGDGALLAESNAILYYLARDTPFFPTALLDQAHVLQWMCFEQYSHEPNIATLRYWITHKVEMTPERRAALPGKRVQGQAALKVMENHLAKHGWFVGGGYSIADIALYAYTHVAEQGGFELKPYPALNAWLKRVASRPGHIPITKG